jgi:competence protein ComEC
LKNKNLVIVSILLVLLVVVILVTVVLGGSDTGPKPDGRTAGKTQGYDIKTPVIQRSPTPTGSGSSEEIKESPLPVSGGEIKVHFIDCGSKADAIFIEAGSETMLIDAGENPNGKQVVSYIEALGYDTINVLVGTHPDKDHIGGIDTVIKKLKIRKFFMPDVTEKSNEYEDVVDEAKDNGLMISVPFAGQKFMLGEAECTVLAPLGSQYDDINNYSIVIRMRYGANSFLFTGDIQTSVEEKLVNSEFILRSDVMKVSYHGGESASSLEFLDKVKPTYAVFMCKEGDGTGRPSGSIINRYNMLGINIYRTDYNGTIVFTSDGKNINVQAGK